MTDTTNIRNQLHGMIRERLFGAGPWLQPRETNMALHERLLEWGLIKDIGSDSHVQTALGSELDLGMLVLFLGHHWAWEIPDLLAEYGLISNEEADELIFVRFEQNGEAPEDVLPPILRRIYAERFGTP